MTTPPRAILEHDRRMVVNTFKATDEAATDRARVRLEYARSVADLEARLVEHADNPEAVRAELARLTHMDELAKAVERERISRTARRTLDHEEAEDDLRLPPPREDYTLAS